MDLLDLLGYIPLDNIISLQTVSLNVFNNNLKLHLSLTPYLNCWTVSPSIILLGIRTAINPNIGCTPAKLIYGTTLRLPEAFFNPTDNSVTIDPADYVQNLKNNRVYMQYPRKSLPIDQYMYLLTFSLILTYLFNMLPCTNHYNHHKMVLTKLYCI